MVDRVSDAFCADYEGTFKFELGSHVRHKLMPHRVGVVLSQSLVRSGDPGFSRVYLVKVVVQPTAVTEAALLGSEYWMEAETGAFESEAKQLPVQ